MRVEMRLMQFPNFFPPAPAIAGSPSRNEKRAASSRLRSRKRAAVSVEPDRETPDQVLHLASPMMASCTLWSRLARGYAWAGNRFGEHKQPGHDQAGDPMTVRLRMGEWQALRWA